MDPVLFIVLRVELHVHKNTIRLFEANNTEMRINTTKVNHSDDSSEKLHCNDYKQ